MNGIIVFQDANAHPLAWLLKPGFRHVWCAILDPERGWTSYDWRMGLPIIRMEAAPAYDLAQHYRQQGYTVLDIEVGTIPTYTPLTLNNCVGHTKLVMGVKSWAVTPHQLYKHLTKETTMWSRIRQLMTLPGFGGGSTPAPPPPPPPPPTPPKKTDEAVQQARTDEKRRARLRAGQAGTIKTPVTGVGDAMTTKTLLGQ